MVTKLKTGLLSPIPRCHPGLPAAIRSRASAGLGGGGCCLPGSYERQAGQALAEACVVLAIVIVLFFAVIRASREQMQWHQDLVQTHTVALSVAHGHADAARGSMNGPLQGIARTVWDRIKKIGISLLDPLIDGIARKIPLPGQKTGLGTAIGRSIVNAGRNMATEIAANEIDDFDPDQALSALDRLVSYLRRSRKMLAGFDRGYQIQVNDVDRDLLSENVHLSQVMDGSMQWVKVRSHSRYANHAWQIRGQGALAYTHDTIDRIDGSEDLWQKATRPSRALVKRLAPMTRKVDEPWGRPAPATDWLSKWSEVSDVHVPDKPTGVMGLVSDVLELTRGVF